MAVLQIIGEPWKIVSVKVDGQYMTEFNGACIIGTEIILYPDGSYNSYVPCQDDHYPSYPGNYSYGIIGNDKIYFSNTDTCQFEVLGPFRFQTRNLAEVFNGIDTTILEIQTVYEKQ
jgi:hypothetical protein